MQSSVGTISTLLLSGWRHRRAFLGERSFPQILLHTTMDPLMVMPITKTRVNVAGERQSFPKLQV